MTERATIESILKDAYAARLRGDVEGMVRHFADDAVFALAGAREASPVALRCNDCDSMRAAMAGLVGAFEFKSHEIVALVVEGDRAVAHTRVRVRAAATGEEAGHRDGRHRHL
jgi:ketosteroid isomerase-like protein